MPSTYPSIAAPPTHGACPAIRVSRIRAGEAPSSARRVLASVSILVVLAGLAFILICAGTGQSVQIIRNAVCTANAGQIDCNSSGLGGITNAADALISPILVALFAVSPIACLIGVGAVMVGNRRGIVIIASALGALVLAGAVKGIVA